MKRACLIFLLVASIFFSFAVSSQAQWAVTYKGSQIYAIHKTPDDGFITSIGEAQGVRVQKLDLMGVPLWSNYYYYYPDRNLYYYSGWGSPLLRSPLRLTADEGYALATQVQQQPDGSYGAGKEDIWFLKLDADGDIEWQRTYGGPEYDAPYDMQQTSDGGFVLAGRTSSFGQKGLWVIKLDSEGNVEWEKVYGGYHATSIQQTADDGYIVTGWTSSAGAGGDDIWVLKLDANGDIEPGLQKTFGGANDDTGYVIKQTADGGYILGGETRSFNIQSEIKACMWILKLDASLNVTWQKTYSGTSLLPDAYGVDREIPHDIVQTADGHFIVAGSTNHFGHGTQEAWILKLDASNQGAVLWEHTYGGEEHWGPPVERSEAFFSVIEAADGSITAAGSTQMTLGELGFVVTMDADGQIPGCSIMGESSAVVTATDVTGQTTQANPQTTTASTHLPPGAARPTNPGIKEFICPSGIDLSIQIEDTPDPVRPDNYIAYVLTAENQGTDQTTGVSVTAELPVGLTYFSSTSTQGSDLESGGTVTFDVGTLAAGESATLTIIARAGASGSYTVEASITAAEIAFDNVLENNTDSETTQVSSWLNATVDSMDWADVDMAVDSKGFAHLVYTKDNDLRYASNTSGKWLRWTLVGSGNVVSVAIAVDPADRIHVAYGEGDEPYAQDRALKYINNISGAWSSPQTVVASAGRTWSISMAVGTDDSLHLCYLDSGPADPQANLIYMTTQDQAPGEWTGVGLHPAGYDATALALDSDNHAHVIFYSPQVIVGNFTTGGVGYTTNAPNGVWQSIEEVDEDWSGGQMEGMDLDIAVDADNVPHIVFSGDSDGDYQEDTRYAVRDGGVWTLDKVEDGGYGSAGKSISLDRDGSAHVSYYHTPTSSLRVANNTTGPWDITTISSDGWFNTIAVDRLGQAHVGYYDGGLLKYALVQSLPDGDGDGISDVEEASAPNGGDGNSDGTQDSDQSHVASLETFDNAQMVTLVAPDSTVLTQVRSMNTPGPEGMPENAVFPFGFFGFTLLGADAGQGASVDLLLPDDTTNSYFKYGPTPIDPSEHYYLFEDDGQTGANAVGSTITLNLVDGQRGDRDLVANGILRDPGGPAVGPAGLQQIRLSPPILEYGEVTVGEFAALDLTIENAGSANLSVDSISAPGAPFGIIADACSGEILLVGGSCVVGVRFEPLSLGDAREVILVMSDDPSFPQLGITLLGTGLPTPEPDIQATPVSLDFGDVDVGSSADLDLSVTNSGMETLHVGSVVAPSGPFSIVEDSVSNAVIHTGDSAQLTIRFEPVSGGLVTASLQIPSDDPDTTTLVVSIAGSGLGAPVPDIAVSVSTLAFGDVTTGDSSDGILTIENIGTAALNISTIAAPDAPFSIQSDTCSDQTLATGADCTMNIRFAPDASVSYTDSLSISSNDPDENPLLVGLSGSGVDPETPVLSIPITTLDFGEATTQDTFSIGNTGTGTLSWTISPALPDWLSVTPMSGDVTSTPVIVTVTVNRDLAQDFGNHNTNILISSNGGSGSVFVEMIKINPNAPVLVVSPKTLDFGESTTQDTFSISNTGTGTLSWAIGPALPDWLTVSPMSGETTSTPADVTVTVDRSLAQGSGNHNTSIQITSDGGNDSVSVNMTKPNTAPVAVATFDPDNVPAGDPVQLDGTGSYDPDGDTITYQWSWEFDPENETAPPAYGAYISDYQSPNPVFTSPYAGQMPISLTVSDGTLESEKVLINITLVNNDDENTLPIADAGEDRMVVVDNPLQLDGTGSSDPDGGPIVFYEWQFVWDEENGTAPGALGATLTDYQTAHPVFSCSRPGQFTLSLVVTDSRRGESAPDLIHLTVQDASLSHSDTDGIPDADELGPDGTTMDFDGNGDQIPDRDQNNVASMHTQSGNDYITLASPGGTFLSVVQGLDGSSGGTLPAGYSFPQQFFAFTINNVGNGGSTTLTIYLPEGKSADTYYKYGPTLQNANPHWYEFTWDGTTGAQINGNVITLTFVDAQRGDDVLIADGKVVDLGGPGIAVADVSSGGGGGGGGGCFIDTAK